MRYDIVSRTDIGTTKQVNQDAVYTACFEGPYGDAVFAILCDGMGGLTHGEIASAAIVETFSDWAGRYIPAAGPLELTDRAIRDQWTRLIAQLNSDIRLYGEQYGFRLGSTVTVMLLTSERSYIMNVGDSRAYEIYGDIRQITVDHTLIEDQIRRGNMTPEQAQMSPIRSVLTRCVGINPEVEPDMFFGVPEADAVYMLCSDGFRHKLTPEELRECLGGFPGCGHEEREQAVQYLVDLNKARGETDNISVIVITARNYD